VNGKNFYLDHTRSLHDHFPINMTSTTGSPTVTIQGQIRIEGRGRGYSVSCSHLTHWSAVRQAEFAVCQSAEFGDIIVASVDSQSPFSATIVTENGDSPFLATILEKLIFAVLYL